MSKIERCDAINDDAFEPYEVLKAPEKTLDVATYTYNKRASRYQVRVTGYTSAEWAGCDVPVILKGGKIQWEKLTRCVWTGTDDMDFPGHPATGLPVATYDFEQRTVEPKQKLNIEERFGVTKSESK